MSSKTDTKVKIINDCPIGKYKAGEIGTLLHNDFEKYDYRVELPPVQVAEEMRDCTFMPKSGGVARVLYFYADQVEIVPQEDEDEDEDRGFSPR